MVRNTISSLYTGKCTIYQTEEVFDPVTKRTSFKDVLLCSNEPCRLSHNSKTSAKRSDTVSAVSQSIKLFLAPDLEVKAGSKIEVTQNGRTRLYVASGEPSVYSNHQEIELEIEDDVA